MRTEEVEQNRNLEPGQRLWEWLDWYEQFGDYVTAQSVRPLCYPRCREQPEPAGSIVLVHGLSDSPWFLDDIAEFFFSEMGLNVYQPLLQCHGLAEPRQMEGVSLEVWRSNVSWAVERAAAATPGQVSIGGLSTGGALSVDCALTNAQVTGGIYLFSAALGLLAGGTGRLAPVFGDVVESMLRTPWLNRFASRLMHGDEPLTGPAQVRYEYVALVAAAELAHLIADLEQRWRQGAVLNNPVMVGHSLADATADPGAVMQLRNHIGAQMWREVVFAPEEAITHAGLVLANDLYDKHGKLIEPGNPQLLNMLKKLTKPG